MESRYIERLDLAQAATPRLLRKRPIHRWFWFPHSYSPELVEAILEGWGLPKDIWVLDPFVGAGTTLVVAQEQDLRGAVGLDLSPLSVLVSKVKTNYWERGVLEETSAKVVQYAEALASQNYMDHDIEISERLRKAFAESERIALSAIKRAILEKSVHDTVPFFLVALLKVARRISRALPNGGWFRWVQKEPLSAQQVIYQFRQEVGLMIQDIPGSRHKPSTKVRVFRHDARKLDELEENKGREFDLLVTSPPYPNRHDYTRVFHIDLLLMGETEKSILDLRHRSLRSHVEARDVEGGSGFQVPKILEDILEEFPSDADPRVVRMLYGYFDDMYQVLRSAMSVMKKNSLLAFVLGNVRYYGIMVPVDEILTKIAEDLGYCWEETWVIRYRGNSAQQMGKFGRERSRESVIFLRRK